MRLPTGNTTGEFQSLYNQYPTYDQMRKYPVGMVLGGYYNWGGGTNPNYQGTNGYYWSSSAWTSATSAYRLRLYGSAVDPAKYASKYTGFPLRCLALLHQKRGCHPKSFRLPTGGPSGEYQTLYNNYNNYDAMTDTTGPHFILSGRRDGTSTDYQGTYGRYWSSTTFSSATYAYSLHLNGTNSTVGLADNNNERLGFSLRCLAQ